MGADICDGLHYVLSAQVFNVEATGQYRKLFKLYGVTGTGGVDTLQVDTERADIREVKRDEEDGKEKSAAHQAPCR